MKTTLLPIFLILGSSVTAQKITSYSDYTGQPSDAAHARFISLLEHTDSGWHRIEYYVQGPVVKMEGWFEDSACYISNGKLILAYPNKKPEYVGHYVHNKRQGPCLYYHYNGMMADSAVYEAGKPVGTKMGWHRNGIKSDSAFCNADGSGVEVSWFDNGNLSSAGAWAAGHKRQGRWKFFHRNGKLSALELYDHGQLLQKQYYDENGQKQADTTDNARNSSYGPGPAAWRAYLDKNTRWPPGYKITKSDEAAVAVTFTVDEDGKIIDAFISIPFYESFNKEALGVLTSGPRWLPCINHNRRVQDSWTESIIFRQSEDD